MAVFIVHLVCQVTDSIQWAASVTLVYQRGPVTKRKRDWEPGEGLSTHVMASAARGCLVGCCPAIKNVCCSSRGCDALFWPLQLPAFRCKYPHRHTQNWCTQQEGASSSISGGWSYETRGCEDRRWTKVNSWKPRLQRPGWKEIYKITTKPSTKISVHLIWVESD